MTVPGAAGDRDEALRAAKDARDAARAAVAALVTARTRATQEAARLRERSAVEGLGDLAEQAALQERRAAALGPRVGELRELARRAEVAHEALRGEAGEGA